MEDSEELKECRKLCLALMVNADRTLKSMEESLMDYNVEDFHASTQIPSGFERMVSSFLISTASLSAREIPETTSEGVQTYRDWVRAGRPSYSPQEAEFPEGWSEALSETWEDDGV
jgi:hypothetical protein